MGFEARRVAATRAKKAPPPYFSHEFIIANHGDIMSCVLMVVVLGFMFQATVPLSQMVVMPQHNETVQLPGDSGGCFC